MKPKITSMVVIVCLVAMAVYSNYGAIDPCGILKASMYKDLVEESPKAFIHLGGAMIDKTVASLSPVACVKALYQGYINKEATSSDVFADVPNLQDTKIPPTAFPVATTAGPTKWVIREEISPVDDSKNIYISINSEEKVSNRFGSELATLMLRCKENETDAFISIDSYIGHNSTEVTYRLDKAPAVVSNWYVSDTGKAVFSTSGTSFIKKLFGHDKLFVRITPYGDIPAEMVFRLSNLENQIDPLASACHWKQTKATSSSAK